MQPQEYRDIGRRHPDLVALYESATGELALLLDDTLLPPASPANRGRWVAQIRSAVARIGADLEHAGRRGPIRVVQFLPWAVGADVVRRWRCRYDRSLAAGWQRT